MHPEPELSRLLDQARAEAAAQERRLLARDLHDGLAQDLAALGYAVDEVIADAENGGTDSVARLRQVRATITALARETREAIGGLRSGIPVGESLGSALSGAAGRLAQRHGWQLHLDVRETHADLGEAVEVGLFRIAHEALINAAKHARAGSVWLTCRIDGRSAMLAVADDGVGFGGSTTTGDSYGFVTMRERAQLLGASLSVQKRQPTGTSVEVRLGDFRGRKRPQTAADTTGRP